MKFFHLKTALFLLVSTVTFSCIDQVKSSYSFRTMMPIYLEMKDVRAKSLAPIPAQKIESPGKIYIYKDYLLINEPSKGIHIFDNKNPANPINLSFIPIEGNVDLAINSDILYADNYVDLLAFDISNIRAVRMVKRIEDVFTHLYQHSTGKIITFKDTVLTSDSPRWEEDGMWLVRPNLSFSANMAKAASNYGTGGSMARFTLMDGHLFAVDESTLRIFDVLSPAEPKFIKPIELGWGIETIFPFDQKLFIGSNRGMHIYDASKPQNPTRMAVYEHVLACDPVVVNEDYAFVTLRSGNFCVNGVNELQIIDIRDPYQPKLTKAYPLLNPHGLGLAKNYLFVAEGKHGLKSFNASDVLAIDKNQLEFIQSMKSVDLIPGPKSLIVIGPDGVCQYDYSNPAKLKKLSCIQVNDPIEVS
uniref:LVIVD repeat-containing protein n=1 Tax=Algoriphagus sp. TaxID=1872435 RepID=UPI004047C4A2